jgi:hypothetical protein
MYELTGKGIEPVPTIEKRGSSEQKGRGRRDLPRGGEGREGSSRRGEIREKENGIYCTIPSLYFECFEFTSSFKFKFHSSIKYNSFF